MGRIEVHFLSFWKMEAHFCACVCVCCTRTCLSGITPLRESTKSIQYEPKKMGRQWKLIFKSSYQVIECPKSFLDDDDYYTSIARGVFFSVVFVEFLKLSLYHLYTWLEQKEVTVLHTKVGGCDARRGVSDGRFVSRSNLLVQYHIQ